MAFSVASFLLLLTMIVALGALGFAVAWIDHGLKTGSIRIRDFKIPKNKKGEENA